MANKKYNEYQSLGPRPQPQLQPQRRRQRRRRRRHNPRPRPRPQSSPPPSTHPQSSARGPSANALRARANALRARANALHARANALRARANALARIHPPPPSPHQWLSPEELSYVVYHPAHHYGKSLWANFVYLTRLDARHGIR